MDASNPDSPRVRVVGSPTPVADSPVVASLCAAVERTVESYRPAGYRVREVVVMLEEDAEPAPSFTDTNHVFVDVYDSGYGHGI